jgi:alpha-1,6-mannosyltransferase
VKIVDVNAFYAPQGGGVRTYVERKLLAARQMGHELTVIAPGEEDRIEERGGETRVRWLAAPAFPLDRKYRYFDDAARLHEALDEERPGLVEASSPWRSARFVADWQGSAPRALIMHADPLSAYAYRWFGRVASRPTIDRYFNAYWRHLLALDRRFDLVVSASQGLSRRLSDGGLSHVMTIPMGVEPGLFSPALRDPALRAALLAECGLSPDGLMLIGLGRLAPEKRWPLVIEAAMAAGCRAEVGLILIGEGNEAPRLARLVGENPHVKLAGAIRDRDLLARILASGDALIHGCEAETFCIAAAEAKASGLPLIVPDGGGAADQATGPHDRRYRTASGKDAARHILAMNICQRGAIPAESTRLMDAHFTELFAAYAKVAPLRLAA